MKQKGSFFSGILVFFLVLIILGGVGFLGYNVIFKGNMNMSGMNMSSNTDKNNSTDTTNKDSSDSQTDSSSKDSMKMSNDSSSGKSNSSSASSTESNYKLAQVNLALENKANLDKTLAVLNDALKKMTLDPYAATSQTDKNSNSNGQTTNSTQQAGAPATSTQGSSTVNIYTSPNNQVMQSMGQSYDSNKMDQLHKGLYKVSVGMQLLDQLKNNIAIQVEQASVDSKSKSEYYLNQYYTTIQNKNKLTEALGYINEASNLVNINPYVNANGVAYDKDRMSQLHESIYKLAEGVVDLNKLNDNLLKQAVQIGNLAQNASNENQMSNMNMSSSSSLFSNISFGTIVTFVLIAFVVVFVLALIGSILSLFKVAEKKNNT